MADIFTLPSRARPRPVESPPVLPVELDGNRVLIRGQRYHTTVGETAAARIASALMTLEAYGLLDTVRLPEPPRGDAA